MAALPAPHISARRHCSLVFAFNLKMNGWNYNMNTIQRVSAAIAAIICTPVAAADLTIDVSGIESEAGRIYISVHGEFADIKFPDSAGVVVGIWRAAQEGSQRMMIRDLTPGRYAVSAFHDANGNGDLDVNLLGIPIEGYGFANGAVGSMGPPNFDAASVSVGHDAGHAKIKLVY